MTGVGGIELGPSVCEPRRGLAIRRPSDVSSRGGLLGGLASHRISWWGATGARGDSPSVVMCIDAEQERQRGPLIHGPTPPSRASAREARAGGSRTASEQNFRMPCIRASGPHSFSPSDPYGDRDVDGLGSGASRSAAEPRGVAAPGFRGAVHGTTVPQHGEPATSGAVPQGALHSAWPVCRVRGPADAQGSRTPTATRLGGGAQAAPSVRDVAAAQGSAPEPVGEGAGRPFVVSGVPAGAPVPMASAPTVRLVRSFSPVARAASATMSATTGAALVRATSLALKTCFCTGPEFHTLPEVRRICS